MKTKKITSLLLSFVMLLSMVNIFAFAENDAANITVYLTVSDEGTLAKANDGSVMLNKPVTVSDADGDGKVTVNEALIEAHKEYNEENGYELSTYGGAQKLWGKGTTNLLFFVENVGLSTGVTVDTVSDGESLVASVNKDNAYYADWFTFFDETEKNVKVNEEFTLNLKGFYGMTYPAASAISEVIPNISIGLWENGSFSAIDGKTTDENGNVTLSFGKAGTYYVTVSGTVDDEVTTDWMTGATSTVPCPIIACGCRVTVNAEPVQKTEPDKVESYLPAPGQFVNIDGAWQTPEQTLDNTGAITLGAFGGNVVYKYDTPVKNDAKNPYGIDFIVTGNCFKNDDGTAAESAAEPAAVAVSKDGVVWYELAGSEYYTAKTEKNVTVTYENTDTSFEKAIEVPWEDSLGNSGKMPVVEAHEQSYFPNPAYYGAYQTGAGKNETYSDSAVSFCGTMIDYGFYPFGYADSHAANEEMENKAANPYAENHRAEYNGDGFDISWAVDENGNPVVLDEISYIKIYNPVLSYGTGRGEISPEIKSVSLAKQSEEEVGVSGGLLGLTLNGEEIALAEGTYTYTVDGKAAESLKLKPTAENENANIYVSNERVSSGEETTAMGAVSKLRIIVQEGEKEPVIYILNLTNVKSKEYNADLSSLLLTPGDESQTPDNDNAISFVVDESVEAVRFTPQFSNAKASAVLTGDALSSPVALYHNSLSEAIALDDDNNTFTLTVTSENEENSKDFEITIDKESSGTSTGKKTVTVKFSLYGDGKEAIISQKTVNVPKNSTVKYLTELMLNNAGIAYKTNGTYISEINGLAEFDKGKNSGWLFRKNGKISDTGYASTTLEAGDVIKWFYTEDYTEESGYEGGWDSVNSSNRKGGSGGTSAKVNNTSDVTENTANIPENAENSEIPSSIEKLAEYWAYDALKYVYQKGVMQGVSEEDFAPNDKMTRAMLTVMLYRAEKAENKEAKTYFEDVKSGEWYFEAVAWAAENGIVKGVSETHFAPNDYVTREQLALIIYRYAKLKGVDVNDEEETLTFKDAEDISEWAISSVKWASKNKLLSGTPENELLPLAYTTRAQFAVIFMRLCENVLK